MALILLDKDTNIFMLVKVLYSYHICDYYIGLHHIIDLFFKVFLNDTQNVAYFLLSCDCFGLKHQVALANSLGAFALSLGSSVSALKIFLGGSFPGSTSR